MPADLRELSLDQTQSLDAYNEMAADFGLPAVEHQALVLPLSEPVDKPELKSVHKEVLVHAALGRTTPGAATILGIAKESIESAIGEIKKDWNVKNMPEA